MIVRLKRDWFAPNGAFYRKGLNDIPDALADRIPTDAERIEDRKELEDVPRNIQPQPLSQVANDAIGVDLAAETIYQAQKGVVPRRPSGAVVGESTPTESGAAVLSGEHMKTKSSLLGKDSKTLETDPPKDAPKTEKK